MLTQTFTTPVAYLRTLGPALLRLGVRGVFEMNRRMLWTVARLTVRRWLRGPLRLVRRLRDGLPMPMTMQLIDDIQCRAGCSHCVFTGFSVRGPGLTLAEMGRLLDEAEDLDVTYVYLIGSDPFYRDDPGALLALLAARKNQVFYLFTEGRRVTTAWLDAIAAAGNIVPVLNIDGLAAATDARKGDGTFARVETLVAGLRTRRIPWFVTTMAARQTLDAVTDPAYVDWLQAHGAWILAYTPYTPADARADDADVMTPDQREILYERSLALTRGRPNPVVLDLLGVEEHLTSCPAGKYTVTVFHDGTLTPCVALPLGTSDVKDRGLRHAFLHDPLYNAIRAFKKGKRKPPCMAFSDPTFLRTYLRDHPGEVRVLSPAIVDKLVGP